MLSLPVQTPIPLQTPVHSNGVVGINLERTCPAGYTLVRDDAIYP